MLTSTTPQHGAEGAADALWHLVIATRSFADFHPEASLRDEGTPSLLTTRTGASDSGALVTAHGDGLVKAARGLAATSSGARPDPPLLPAPDEVGNRLLTDRQVVA
jgi:hypothetical protein